MEAVTRPIDAFSAVELCAFGDLEITYGDEPALRIEAPQSVLDRLDTDVEDGCLVLRIRPLGWFGHHGQVRYFATTPQPVRRIGLSGSGKVLLPATEVDDLSIRLSGSGDVNTQTVKASTVELTIKGSGSISLDGMETVRAEAAIYGSGKVIVQDGAATSLELRIPGSGELDFGAVRSDEVRVDIAGSGVGKVWAVERLSVCIAGSGKVLYRGRPAIEQHVSGIGKVAAADE